jgi:hypothetical protein
MKKISSFPFHLALFAIYPVLQLLATNIIEVNVGVIWRPLLISLFTAVILALVGFPLFRNFQKSAIFSVVLVISFFTFGHLHGWLRSIPEIGLALGRFRYLVVFYVFVILISAYLLYFRVKDQAPLTATFNFASIVLFLIPIYQIVSYNINHLILQRDSDRLEESRVQISNQEDLPDIYLIILDTYTRADILESDFNLDNSAFIDQLQDLGFYVAECARSNYPSTIRSLVSLLNVAYVHELEKTNFQSELRYRDNLMNGLSNNLVREKLVDMGYKTVAFSTGYEWSTYSDSDYFFTPEPTYFLSPRIQPFEALLLQKSALLMLVGGQPEKIEGLLHLNAPLYAGHVLRVKNVLEKLPEIPDLPGSKFIFAHILSPHRPFIFLPDGSINEDDRFYSNDGNGIDENYSRQGYAYQVQYINNQLIPILTRIIEKSKVPPIIIIQGDHGSSQADRYPILNAYYLPDDLAEQLYPDISPVNSFRLVFNDFFERSYPLLDDVSYSVARSREISGTYIYKPVEETAPACLNSDR